MKKPRKRRWGDTTRFYRPSSRSSTPQPRQILARFSSPRSGSFRPNFSASVPSPVWPEQADADRLPPPFQRRSCSPLRQPRPPDDARPRPPDLAAAKRPLPAPLQSARMSPWSRCAAGRELPSPAGKVCNGRVPAVLLTLTGPGPGDGVAHRKLLTADRKLLGEMLKQSPYFLSTPVRLQVRAGERSTAVVHSGTVLPIKVHRDETTGNILNLVMVQADEGTMLKVNLPVEFKGEDVCPGLKKGCSGHH